MNQAEVKRKQTEEFANILALITIWILGNRLTEGGISYMTAAVSACVLVGTAVSGSLADTLGKLLRGRRNKGQYKNILSMRRSALFFHGALGLAGTIALILFAGGIAEGVIRIPVCTFPVIALAPVVVLRTLTCVLQGYFQGEAAELPRAVSAVLRQVFLLGFGLLFGGILSGYGEKVSGLLREESYTAMYGCLGIALAACLAEAFILLFLTVLFRSSRRSERKMKQDGMYAGETAMDCILNLCAGRWPLFLTDLFRCLSLFLGLFLFGRQETAPVEETSLLQQIFFRLSALFPENASLPWSALIAGNEMLSEGALPELMQGSALIPYDTYVGRYLVICGIAVFVISILVLPAMGKIFLYFRREEGRFARTAFQSGFHICLVHGIFLSMYLAVMASPLSELTEGENGELVRQMIQGGATAVALASLSMYFARFLQTMGRKYLLSAAFGIADVVFAVTALLLAKSGILALVYGGVAFTLVLSIGLGLLSYRQLRMRMDWLGVLVVPLGAGVAAGLICMLLNRLLGSVLGGPGLLLAAFVFSAAVYWVLLLVLRNFKEQELESIPGGRILLSISQIMHRY